MKKSQEPPFFDSFSEEEPPELLQRDTGTQTIDLGIPSEDGLTDSGSFDFGDLERTAVGKLIQSLPLPTAVVGESGQVLFANQAWETFIADYTGTPSFSIFSLFPSPTSAEKVKLTVRESFLTRKTRTVEAVIKVEQQAKWGRMTFGPLRFRAERSLLLLVEDLTLQKKQALVSNKHRKEMQDYNERLRQEIQQRKRVEEELRVREHQYRQLVENAGDIIYGTDANGYFTFVNTVAERIIGYSPPDLVGTHYLEIVHPEFRDQTGRFYGRQLVKRIPDTFCECPVLTRDGSVVWLGQHTHLLMDGETIVGFQSVARDITDRKRVEDALRESEERMRTLINAVPDNICFKDGEGRWQEANESILKLFNLENVQFRGKKDSELAALSEFHRDALLACEETDERAWAARGISRADEFVTRQDGSRAVFDVIKVPLFYPDGSRKAMVVVGRCMTELRAAEELRRESERKYRDLFDHSIDAIALVREGGEFIDVNESFGRLLGYTKEEALRMNAWQIWADPANRAKWQQQMARTGFVMDYEWKGRRKDGTVIDCLLSSSQQRAKDGSIVYQTLCRDISELKRARDLLLQAARFRAVADLSSGVAHNFSNLLQIVIGNAHLGIKNLQSGELSDLERNLKRIIDSSEFGAETVRRLNRFSRTHLESETSSATELFDLSDLARQAVEMTKPLWKTHPEKKGIVVDLKTSLADGCLIQGRKNEIFEVVVNLIKNATESLLNGGDIRIETRVEADWAILGVRDTGVGINEKDVDRLFTPFVTTKAEFGRGLGLAITRKIVDEHGGRISVKSTEGQGALFTVSLPRARVTPEMTPPAPTVIEDKPLSVLVIDDMPAMVDMLRDGLEAFGHTAFTAQSGEEGLAFFRDNPVDLVICDLGLHGINGWDVGKAIKSYCLERKIPKPPFVILTGWSDQSGETEKIAESGVDRVIQKPIDMFRLLEGIRPLV